ncbi:MAG: hypothetical protein LUC88_09675 [Prevotella sp.]|nr:hypothetical protein [Prevotella sp.]
MKNKYCVNEMLREMYQKPLTQKVKVYEFEKIKKRLFLTALSYINLVNARLWDEFSKKKDLGVTDFSVNKIDYYRLNQNIFIVN